jgi:DNA-binding transcriptional LysR family regulator
MIRRLEFALAIDTHRSFGRAARALGVSQPSLTRALQVLETELGARLFERDKADCEPTEFGRIVLFRARRMLSELSETKREIALLQGLQIGEFRIGAGMFATQVWMGKAIGELSAAHPKLRVRSIEYFWSQLPDALMAAEIDVGVGEATDLPENSEIVVGRFPRRRGRFVCRTGHPLAKLETVTLADLASYPLASTYIPRRMAVHLPLDSALGAMSGDGRHFVPSILCAAWAGIGDVVERSDALGIAPNAALLALRQRQGLVALPFDAPWMCTEHALMWRRDRMLHPALKVFCAAARRYEAETMGVKESR